MRKQAPFEPIDPNTCIWGGVPDTINHANFFWKSTQGFRCWQTPKSKYGISHWLCWSSLQHSHTTVWGVILRSFAVKQSLKCLILVSRCRQWPALAMRVVMEAELLHTTLLTRYGLNETGILQGSDIRVIPIKTSWKNAAKTCTKLNSVCRASK